MNFADRRVSAETGSRCFFFGSARFRGNAWHPPPSYYPPPLSARGPDYQKHHFGLKNDTAVISWLFWLSR